MIPRRFVSLLLAPLLAASLAAAAYAGEGNKNAVRQDNRIPPQYLQMPRMAVAVPVKGSEISRELEVQLWIYVADPQKMLKLNGVRSVVADEIREGLKKNPAQTYLAPEEGPSAVKEVARDAVEKQIGKDADETILIKSMLVR